MTVEAVLFDWGGTLTPWHTIDFAECWRACGLGEKAADRLLAAEEAVWQRAQTSQQSGTLDEVFSAAGVHMSQHLLAAYFAWWEGHTYTDPEASPLFAALHAVGCTDPGRAVFVGDRLFDDIHGARSVGMRAVFVPHSDIPEHQRGTVDGTPDAVIHRLAELLPLIDAWR